MQSEESQSRPSWSTEPELCCWTRTSYADVLQPNKMHTVTMNHYLKKKKTDLCIGWWQTLSATESTPSRLCSFWIACNLKTVAMQHTDWQTAHRKQQQQSFQCNQLLQVCWIKCYFLSCWLLRVDTVPYWWLKGPLCRIPIPPLPLSSQVVMYDGHQVPIVYFQVLMFALSCLFSAT